MVGLCLFYFDWLVVTVGGSLICLRGCFVWLCLWSLLWVVTLMYVLVCVGLLVHYYNSWWCLLTWLFMFTCLWVCLIIYFMLTVLLLVVDGFVGYLFVGYCYLFLFGYLIVLCDSLSFVCGYLRFISVVGLFVLDLFVVYVWYDSLFIVLVGWWLWLLYLDSVCL